MPKHSHGKCPKPFQLFDEAKVEMWVSPKVSHTGKVEIQFSDFSFPSFGMHSLIGMYIRDAYAKFEETLEALMGKNGKNLLTTFACELGGMASKVIIRRTCMT